VPPSKKPDEPQMIARLATIPHGDSVLAQGKGTFPPLKGGPKIPKVNPAPFNPKTGKPIGFGYFPPDPPSFPQVNPFPIPKGFNLDNPNAALTEAIKDQRITHTTVLEVSTRAGRSGPFGGGILNIPFVMKNADAIQLDAIFWIERVAPPKHAPRGTEPFLQLQYTQTVILSFPPEPGKPVINWPHVSGGTLVKQ